MTTPPSVVPDAAAAAGDSAVPILPSPDLDQSLAFYRYLGFRLLGCTTDYARVALGPVEVHLYLDPALEPTTNGRGCYLRLAGAAALYAAWSQDGVACLDVPGADGYGPTLFAVVDPGGNTVRIGPPPGAARLPAAKVTEQP